MLNLTIMERRALIIFVVVIFASILVQWLVPHHSNSEIFDYSMEDSLFKALSRDTMKHVEHTIEEKTILKPERKKSSKTKKQLAFKSININTATQKELELLPRIGPVTAGAIIEYRQVNGDFRSLSEITKVRRIGPKTLEQIEPFIFILSDTTDH